MSEVPAGLAAGSDLYVVAGVRSTGDKGQVIKCIDRIQR
jgi:hypothetical protein